MNPAAEGPLENLDVICAGIGATAKGNFGWRSSAEKEGAMETTLTRPPIHTDDLGRRSLRSRRSGIVQ